MGRATPGGALKGVCSLSTLYVFTPSGTSALVEVPFRLVVWLEMLKDAGQSGYFRCLPGPVFGGGLRVCDTVGVRAVRRCWPPSRACACSPDAPARLVPLQGARPRRCRGPRPRRHRDPPRSRRPGARYRRCSPRIGPTPGCDDGRPAAAEREGEPLGRSTPADGGTRHVQTAELVDKATGKPVPPVTPPENDGVTSTLIRTGGTWKVSKQTVTDGKCAPGS